MPTYKERAIVLRTWDVGEADRVISLFTHGSGKVRAVARSVRKTTSKFGSRLEPGSHVDVQLAIGRGSLDIVTQVEIVHEPLLGMNYERFTAAQVLLEAAEYLVPEERIPAPAQFRLLLGALVALTYRAQRLVVDSYLLRALAIDGQPVALERCAVCGGDPQWFSPQRGGALCHTCRTPGATMFGAKSRSHMIALLTGDWKTLEQCDDAVARRSHGLVEAYTSWFMERRLRSLAFLDRD